MNSRLRDLPIIERIKLVEDLWDSIAQDQGALAITPEQRSELDKRLDALDVDAYPGKPAGEVVAKIRKEL